MMLHAAFAIIHLPAAAARFAAMCYFREVWTPGFGGKLTNVLDRNTSPESRSNLR